MHFFVVMSFFYETKAELIVGAHTSVHSGHKLTWTPSQTRKAVMSSEAGILEHELK